VFLEPPAQLLDFIGRDHHPNWMAVARR
jgi:hypothetical protein